MHGRVAKELRRGLRGEAWGGGVGLGVRSVSAGRSLPWPSASWPLMHLHEGGGCGRGSGLFQLRQAAANRGGSTS